jgi:dienelactone hydrolase
VAAQEPEERGSFDVAEWDAGTLDAAGAPIRRRVVYPTSGAGPFPLVGVIHGAGRNGGRHIELARTLASRGYIAVLPDMPCSITSCDHDANAAQITALLEWAVAESGMGSSMLSGLVDGSRRGLIGHSWGALASHIAASRDSTIDSVVLFDPNDDGTEGLSATPGITAPTLQLLASVAGACNSAWNEASVTSMLPDPKLQLTVSGSGHCDPEEPGDSFCGFACGSGDASTSTIFRRYAVAWTACVLGSDATMGAWLGGASMTADEGAGRIEGVGASGLDDLPCRGGVVPPIDGGAPDTDGGPARDAGGVVPPVDAGRGAPDGGSPRIDSGPSAGGSADDGGCGCIAPAAAGRDLPALAVFAAITVALLTRSRARRRRRGPRGRR